MPRQYFDDRDGGRLRARVFLINLVFLKRLLTLVLLIGGIQLSLAFSSLRWMPAAPLAEVFLIGALILHKRSTSIDWLSARTEPPLRVFIKVFFVYVLPAGTLWILFVVGIFRDYLTRIGVVRSPPRASLLATGGVLVLCMALVSEELSHLGRSPR